MATLADLQDLLTTDLKTWFHDCFLSHDQVDTSLTQTAAAYQHVGQLKIETGVQEGSEARANYERSFFNPRYATVRFKVRISDAADAFAFFGFKDTLTAPTWGMTESHAGFMLYEGVLYLVTGNGDADAPANQVTPITDIDITRWLIYELSFYSGRWYSLPYTVPYFDKNVLAGLKQGMTRKWSNWTRNGSILPSDEMHYLVFYISNSTGASKSLEVQHVDYQEVYPD